ncbi:MAG: class I SAM-dependent methyltransferase [Pirellulales bacterium]|nr:class I SAM-dependent methyltransferase [Pirellulales bacterium]
MACRTLGFGIDPGFRPYPLKLARYQALAESIAAYADAHGPEGQLDLLDVGMGTGICRRFSEPYRTTRRIRFHGVDRLSDAAAQVYKADSWKLHNGDLEEGLPFLESNRYDIVVCEQVLEHLYHPETAAGEIVRVLKPGGLLIVGVPIFPHGVHYLRRHVVQVLGRLPRSKKDRGHVQGFSLRTFLNLLRHSGPIEIQQVRGFRIVSGGVLRPLENYRWWWQLNRQIGSLVPFLCIEIQVVATKTAASPEEIEPVLLPLHRDYPNELRPAA